MRGRNLTGLERGDYLVDHVDDVREPIHNHHLVSQRSWICKCRHCGALRSISQDALIRNLGYLVCEDEKCRRSRPRRPVVTSMRAMQAGKKKKEQEAK